MMPQHVLETHRYVRCPCWLSTDTVPNRALTPISPIATTQALLIETTPNPVARSSLQSSARDPAKSRTLQLRGTTSKSESAANSP